MFVFLNIKNYCELLFRMSYTVMVMVMVKYKLGVSLYLYVKCFHSGAVSNWSCQGDEVI